jgi:hypothetical protein
MFERVDGCLLGGWSLWIGPLVIGEWSPGVGFFRKVFGSSLQTWHLVIRKFWYANFLSVGKIYVAAAIIIMLAAPKTKIAGEFNVCVLKEKMKILTGFDDVCKI